MKDMPEDKDYGSMGEDLGTPMEIPVADLANSKAESTTSEHTYIDLKESGEHRFKNMRFGAPTKEGFVTAYTASREWVSDHEEVVWIPLALVAVGAVIAGIHHLKHKQK